MIRDTFLCIVALPCILCALALILLAEITGQGKRLGPRLVRGKYWLLRLLAGGRKELDAALQAAIMILGGIGGALHILGMDARLGAAIALAGQPFWIVATWRARQWGILAVVLWWTGVWAVAAAKAWGWG